MGDLTPKLNLYLPGGGSSGTILPDEPLDIDKINQNMVKIDAAYGVLTCTSSTHPASPIPGQIIFETDTLKTLYWNGSAYAPLSSPVSGLDAGVITTGVFVPARIPTLDLLLGTLDIASGGTGATTAAGARANLGVVPMSSGSAAPSGGNDGDWYAQII